MHCWCIQIMHTIIIIYEYKLHESFFFLVLYINVSTHTEIWISGFEETPSCTEKNHLCTVSMMLIC